MNNGIKPRNRAVYRLVFVGLSLIMFLVNSDINLIVFSVADEYQNETVLEETIIEEESQPAQEEETSAQEEETSAQEEEPSAQEEEPSAQEEETSAQEEESSAQEEETSAQEEETSAQEEESSAQEEEPSAQEEETSAQEEETSVQEEEPSAQEESQPAQEESQPVQEEKIFEKVEEIQLGLSLGVSTGGEEIQLGLSLGASSLGELQPTSLLLQDGLLPIEPVPGDPTAVYVRTFQGLKTALSVNNNITKILLRANIVMEGGISIYKTKETILIDGDIPESTLSSARYVLTDYKSNSFNSTIYIDGNNTALKSVTLKNLTILGHNIYGTVSVYITKAIDILYDNVAYTGPQMTHNLIGKTTYKDCVINIEDTSFAQSQELAETNYIVFQGKNEINHKTSASLTPTFATGFLGDKATMDIEEGAIVNIKTNVAFNWNYNTSKPFERFTVHKGASFNLDSRYGFNLGVLTSNIIKNLIVEEDAVFSVKRQEGYWSPKDNVCISVDYLQVVPGATFNMESKAANGGALILFASTSKTSSFNNANINLSNKNWAVFSWVNKDQNLQIVSEKIDMWEDTSTASIPHYVLSYGNGNLITMAIKSKVSSAPDASVGYDAGIITQLPTDYNLKNVRLITSSYKEVGADTYNIVTEVCDVDNSLTIQTIPGGVFSVSFLPGDLPEVEENDYLKLSIGGVTSWTAGSDGYRTIYPENTNFFIPYTDIVVKFKNGINKKALLIVKDTIKPDVSEAVAYTQITDGLSLPDINFASWFGGVTDNAQITYHPDLYFNLVNPLDTYPPGPTTLYFTVSDYEGNVAETAIPLRVMFDDGNIAYSGDYKYALYAKSVTIIPITYLGAALGEEPEDLKIDPPLDELMLRMSETKAWEWQKETDYDITNRVVIGNRGDMTRHSTGYYDSPPGDPGNPYEIIPAVFEGDEVLVFKTIQITISEEILTFMQVPPSPKFLTLWHSLEEKVLPRIPDSWEMFYVYDGRKSGDRSWSVMGQLVDEIKTNDGILFPGNLIFRNENQLDQVFSTTRAIKVYSSSVPNELPVYQITWPNSQGILLKTNFLMLEQDKEYHTKILWTLINAP